ncbi:hypothetical protein DFH07DRAFT_4972 [Mycena maculata]|uniref:Uncharacterized protein n=1 Tax=Mycena maculata TaxID=230809 RepID=A0AAD7KGX3_9AGAR|nr:hypothetical protein DFH07DRAFT_4972 [Mycena maculata]
MTKSSAHLSMHSQEVDARCRLPRVPHKHRRGRITSAVSIRPTGNALKIALRNAVAPLDPHNSEHPTAVGAFTLTGCPRASLRSFAPASPPFDANPHEHLVYADLPVCFPRPSDSPPASPALSLASIPSISRTASPFEIEYESIPPGWGAGHKGKDRDRVRVRTPRGTQTHSALGSLERTSRVGTGRVVCAACKKHGSNFPRCRRCSKMWCSRQCRLSSLHRCGTWNEQAK